MSDLTGDQTGIVRVKVNLHDIRADVTSSTQKYSIRFNNNKKKKKKDVIAGYESQTRNKMRLGGFVKLLGAREGERKRAETEPLLSR